jgi:outer membrane immunogenic protein
MRIKVFALASTLALLLGTATQSRAADLPSVGKAPTVAVPVAYNWTGFYVGGHAGYGWGSGDTAIGLTDAAGVLQGAAALGIFPLQYSYDRDGFVAGGQIGYNWQTGAWVLGVEADFSATGIDGSSTVTTNVVGFAFPNTSSVSQDMDWFGTVRGRVGYAANNWLFYGTGGLAYGRVNYTYRQTNAPLGAINILGSQSNVEVGWTIGGGIEYGFGQWSVRAEYLYYDLGDTTFAVPHNLAPTALFNPNFDNTGSIVRAALNYRFR